MPFTEYILLCFLFYLSGSIPTAYIVLKKSSGKDITKEGSGNVGALNSYEISNSRITGITVLAVDFLKGFIPAYLFLKAGGYALETMIIPLSLIVAGHNFSVWIKFKGGRGLATAAGIAIAAAPWALLIWCLVFIISFGIYRNVHFGNISATVLMPILYYILTKYFPVSGVSNPDAGIILVIIISLLILLKHIQPMIELIKGFRKKPAN